MNRTADLLDHAPTTNGTSPPPVVESWTLRLWQFVRNTFRAHSRRHTALEDDLLATSTRLARHIEDLEARLRARDVEIESLKGQLAVNDVHIKALAEVIESLRRNREADIEIDAKRIALANAYYRQVTGGTP